MDIADILAGMQGGQAFDQLGRQFGLSADQTRSAVEALAPVIAAGISRNASQGGGLGDLIGAVLTGGHGRYAEDPRSTQFDAVADDGNAILGHIFGSKDVSRGVAQQLSASSGIGAAILKKMLPVIASMVMGVLAKKMLGGRAAAAPSGGGGLGDILGDILGGALGGGSEPAPAPQRRVPQGQGGGLEDILKDILGGGSGGQAGPVIAKKIQVPPGGQMPDLNDILKDIFGGGAGSGIPEAQDRGRDIVEESLGRPRRSSRSSDPAGDLLNSVEEAIRRR
jgi:hypothetical protein